MQQMRARNEGQRPSRLAVRPCPSCRYETLVSNGAFWKCDVCELAVASAALMKDVECSEDIVPLPPRPVRQRLVVPHTPKSTMWESIQTFVKTLSKPGPVAGYGTVKGES